MNRYWAAVRVMAIGAALGGSVALSQTRSADEDCLVLVRSEVLPVRISFDTGAALTLTPSEDARSVSLRPGARTLEARAGGKVLRKPFEPRGDRYLLWIGADDSWEAEQAESPPASASPAPESGDRAGKETGPGVVIILLVCAAVLGLGLCLRPGLRHLLAVRESSPSPPPLADVTYVVFCRLTGLKGMAADTVAAHCEALATAICTACGGDRSYRTYSSVYGRFVLVPSRGGAALELAVRIHQRCAAAGMRVAIAIAAGRVEATRDLLDDNVAGVAINRAARLAHLPGGTGRVAVDEFTFRDVTGGCSAYSKSVFDPLQHGQVKRTRLKYAWFRCRTPAVGKPPAPCGRHECVTAHVVAYDIVQYSDRDARDQVQVVEDLSHAVRRALEAAGGRPGGANLWYAPAGDGGVVVFRSCSGGARAAWTFVTALLVHTRDRIPVRIGVTTGPVVIIRDNLPVGSGILEADDLSGFAKEGAPCGSCRFWTQLLEPHDRVGWEAVLVPGTDDVFVISPVGSPKGPSPLPPVT